MHQGHDIHLKVPLQHRGIDVQEVGEGAADGIVNDDLGRLGACLDILQGGLEGGGIGDVAGHGEGFGQLAGERLQPRGVAGQHRHLIAALVEAPDERRRSRARRR